MCCSSEKIVETFIHKLVWFCIKYTENSKNIKINNSPKNTEKKQIFKR